MDFKEKVMSGGLSVEVKSGSTTKMSNRNAFIARYPGALGNSLSVEIVDGFVAPAVTSTGGRMNPTLSQPTTVTTIANIFDGDNTKKLADLAGVMFNGFSLESAYLSTVTPSSTVPLASSRMTVQAKIGDILQHVVTNGDLLTTINSVFGSAFADAVTGLGVYESSNAPAVLTSISGWKDLIASVKADITTVDADTTGATARSVFFYKMDSLTDTLQAVTPETELSILAIQDVVISVASVTTNSFFFVPNDIAVLANSSPATYSVVNNSVELTAGTSGFDSTIDLYTFDQQKQAMEAAVPVDLRVTYGLYLNIIGTDNDPATAFTRKLVNWFSNEAARTSSINQALQSTELGTFYKRKLNPVTGVEDAGWQYINVRPEFNIAPGSSDRAEAVNAQNDEIHVVVIDTRGLFSGKKGQVLEAFPFLSKSCDGKSEDGTNVYYVDYINRNSKYVWATEAFDTLVERVNNDGLVSVENEILEGNLSAYGNWGKKFTDQFGDGVTFARLRKPLRYDLNGGSDEFGSIGVDDYIRGYEEYASGERIDVNLVIFGNTESTPVDTVVSQYIIDNVVESRKDCIALLSPAKDTVIGNGIVSRHENVVNYFRDTSEGINRSTSYAVADCNWKLTYDKYSDLERWVPLSGDIAGLCALTDKTRDAWWSPAGFNRGKLKNVIRLAWNPNQAERDELYKNGINPVLSFHGEGPVLYGDKTMLTKPSAFDHINVRRLFIVCEKAIATASKYSLFEFNDAFTRLSFVNMVTPFLSDVQGRRGIYDFRVVCDDTNNTAEVIDRNEFVGDIYIKPARSVNYIQLNFVAVKTGVDFAEVVGKF
jgi:hypothetical protein